MIAIAAIIAVAFALGFRSPAGLTGWLGVIGLALLLSFSVGWFTVALGLNRKDVELKPLKPGARVIAGTILGRIGKTENLVAPNLYFEIRPAGKGAPRVDPKPILDGWKLLEATAIYRAKGKSPFAKLSGAGVLLLSKEALIKRVLADKGL